MGHDSLGFSAAEILLYLCASRCGRGRLSSVLVVVTVIASLAVGIARLLA